MFNTKLFNSKPFNAPNTIIVELELEMPSRSDMSVTFAKKVYSNVNIASRSELVFAPIQRINMQYTTHSNSDLIYAMVKRILTTVKIHSESYVTFIIKLLQHIFTEIISNSELSVMIAPILWVIDGGVLQDWEQEHIPDILWQRVDSSDIDWEG